MTTLTPQNITLRFNATGDKLTPAKLSSLLLLLQITCHLCRENIAGEFTAESIGELTKDDVSPYRELLESAISELSDFRKNEVFLRAQKSKELEIVRIAMSSPLEVCFYVIAGYLLIALVVIGTPIDVKVSGAEVRVQIPSLENFIKALRSLLRLEKKSAGYQVRGVRVVLNTTEMLLLKKKSKGRGGFQSFLRSLSKRAEKESGILYLSNQDIERIQRYSNNYGSGGYQGQLKQIFGRTLGL